MRKTAAKAHLRHLPLATLSTRQWCTLLACWSVCPRAPCRRARACHGNAALCSERNMMLLPAGAYELYLNAGEYGRDHGYDLTYDQARDTLPDDVRFDLLDWEDAVACSLGLRKPVIFNEPWSERGR